MSVRVWKAFQRAFDELPLCARVGRRILAMHGGISPAITTWDSLINLKVSFFKKYFEDFF